MGRCSYCRESGHNVTTCLEKLKDELKRQNDLVATIEKALEIAKEQRAAIERRKAEVTARKEQTCTEDDFEFADKGAQ